jgi:hypothetical protein
VRIKDDIMSLRDENQMLLARVKRGLGRLFKLDLQIVRPVCLAACVLEKMPGGVMTISGM